MTVPKMGPRWVVACSGALLAAGCATPSINPTVQAHPRGFAADLTSEQAQRILADIGAAFASADARALADLVEFAPVGGKSAPSLERAQTLVGARPAFPMSTYFEGLTVRSIDHYRRFPSDAHPECPADAVRVIFERAKPGDRPPHERPRVEVRAFLFVEREGRWKWYWLGGIGPWHRWEYAFDTPESGNSSLLKAIDGRDFRTVYELTDPTQLPANVPLNAWLQMVQERQAAVDKWQADCVAAGIAARAEGRPQPVDPPAPFLTMAHAAHVVTARYQDDQQTVAHVSHLWDYADELNGPVPYETFVKRGDRWYWQPNPRYTLWPLATNMPTSQPDAKQPTTGPAGAPASGDAPDRHVSLVSDQPTTDPAEVVSQAAALAAQIDETGRALVAMVQDSRQPAKLRAQAADLLPRLGYEPGIPALLSEIDLHSGRSDVVRGDEGFTIEFNYPCAGSLPAFGEAAFVPTLRAARADRNPHKRRLYDHVMRQIARNSELARVYLARAAQDEQEPVFRERLNECLRWAEAAAATQRAASQPASQPSSAPSEPKP